MRGVFNTDHHYCSAKHRRSEVALIIFRCADAAPARAAFAEHAGSDYLIDDDVIEPEARGRVSWLNAIVR